MAGFVPIFLFTQSVFPLHHSTKSSFCSFRRKKTLTGFFIVYFGPICVAYTLTHTQNRTNMGEVWPLVITCVFILSVSFPNTLWLKYRQYRDLSFVDSIDIHNHLRIRLIVVGVSSLFALFYTILCTLSLNNNSSGTKKWRFHLASKAFVLSIIPVPWQL